MKKLKENDCKGTRIPPWNKHREKKTYKILFDTVLTSVSVSIWSKGLTLTNKQFHTYITEY